MKACVIALLAICLAAAPLRAAEAAPAPAPAAQQPVQVSPPPDPHMLSRARTFKSIGGASLGLGIGLVAMSGIAWGLRNTALRRADRQRFYVDEQRLIERARRRQVLTGVGLGVGTAMTITGVALLIVGASTKNRAHRRVAFAPALGPRFSGLSTRVRF